MYTRLIDKMFLSTTQFTQLFSPTTHSYPQGDEDDELRHVFAIFDKNGDGYLSRNELQVSTIVVQWPKIQQGTRGVVRICIDMTQLTPFCYIGYTTTAVNVHQAI